MKLEFLGKSEDYQYFGDRIDEYSFLKLHVYANNKRKRFENWHINECGEIFIRAKRDLYFRIHEIKSGGWAFDRNEILRIIRR